MTTVELNTLHPLGTEVTRRGLDWVINGSFQLLSDGKIVVPIKRVVENHGYVAHRMVGLTDLRFGDDANRGVEQGTGGMLRRGD